MGTKRDFWDVLEIFCFQTYFIITFYITLLQTNLILPKKSESVKKNQVKNKIFFQPKFLLISPSVSLSRLLTHFCESHRVVNFLSWKEFQEDFCLSFFIFIDEKTETQRGGVTSPRLAWGSNIEIRTFDGKFNFFFLHSSVVSYHDHMLVVGMLLKILGFPLSASPLSAASLKGSLKHLYVQKYSQGFLIRVKIEHSSTVSCL